MHTTTTTTTDVSKTKMLTKIIDRFIQAIDTLNKKRQKLIFHPNSKIRVVLDVILLFFTVWCLMMVPWDLAFLPSTKTHLLIYAGHVLVIATFWFDVLLNFHTGFFLQGIVVVDRTMIVKYYAKGWMWVDVCSAFPLLFFTTSTTIQRWLALPLLIRIFRINSYFMVLERKRIPLVRLYKILLAFFLINHWNACGYYAYSRINGYAPDTGTEEHAWTMPVFLSTAPLAERYIWALLWGIVNMAGNGSEVSIPSTHAQVTYNYFSIVIGIVMMSVLIGYITSIIAHFHINTRIFQEKRDQVRQFMHSKSLPDFMVHRIESYYEYMWTRAQGLDEGVLLADLPPPLRSEVYLFLNRDIIKKVPLFKDTEQGFINSLLLRLKPSLYMPGDYIIREGEVGREMYFILKGSVDVENAEGIVVATLSEGSFFGEVVLVKGGRRNASIRAKTFCDLFMLKKEDLDAVLAQYPEYHEKVLGIAKNRKTATNVAASRFRAVSRSILPGMKTPHSNLPKQEKRVTLAVPNAGDAEARPPPFSGAKNNTPRAASPLSIVVPSSPGSARKGTPRQAISRLGGLLKRTLSRGTVARLRGQTQVVPYSQGVNNDGTESDTESGGEEEKSNVSGSPKEVELKDSKSNNTSNGNQSSLSNSLNNNTNNNNNNNNNNDNTNRISESNSHNNSTNNSSRQENENKVDYGLSDPKPSIGDQILIDADAKESPREFTRPFIPPLHSPHSSDDSLLDISSPEESVRLRKTGTQRNSMTLSDSSSEG